MHYLSHAFSCLCSEKSYEASIIVLPAEVAENSYHQKCLAMFEQEQVPQATPESSTLTIVQMASFKLLENFHYKSFSDNNL